MIKGFLWAMMLSKLLVLIGLFSVIDGIDTQHDKFIVQGKNEASPPERKPIGRKFFVPMRAISQRKNGDENNVKDFTQKLPPISALDENQAVAKQSLTQFKKENPTNATKTETYDPSDLRNTFKAISLLAHLRSMSLANHLQQNARQQDEDGLADIEHKSQKQNDLMDNRYNSTGKSHLNMDDISGIDNFTLEFRKFIEESANGALRRNPRYSYLYEPISLAYAQNAFEAGMNSNKEDRIKNELKTNEMTNVENSPQFVNSSDFKRTQNLQRKTRQGRSSPEILQNEKPPASSNTSAEHHNVGKNVFEGQLTGNSTDETMSSGNFSEFVNGTYRKIRRTKITRYRIIDGKKVPVETRYDEELVLKTEKHDESDDDYFPEEKNVPAENSNLNIQEFEFKIDRKGDNMNDDTDQDDIKEVSILSNNHEQKIVYAAKSVEEEEEEEPKMSEYDIEENVPKIDFKKKSMPITNSPEETDDDDDTAVKLKKMVYYVTTPAKTVGMLSSRHSILIFISMKILMASF